MVVFSIIYSSQETLEKLLFAVKISVKNKNQGNNATMNKII